MLSYLRIGECGCIDTFMVKRLMKTPVSLGAALAQARIDAGLTQVELAAKAGVSRRWLGELEGGKRPGAELSLVMKTAAALGLQLELHPMPEASAEDKLLGNKMREALKARGLLPA
jgi:transcriptional regulator with XRE-family HTH domain